MKGLVILVAAPMALTGIGLVLMADFLVTWTGADHE